jgi:NADPH2:quinone reductase
MKAIVLTANGPALADCPTPEPGPGEVLVRVRACGLNRADALMAAGHVHGDRGGPGTVLGIEWSGTIERVGAEVDGLVAGNRVMCSGRGGFAEFAVAHPSRMARIPDNLDFEAAATFLVALQTMHDALVTRGSLRHGQSVLIQGAGSGVGIIGLQIAKLLGAGLVIGTSTNAERRARLTEFGADLALDSSDPAWPDHAREAAGGRGVDIIVDMVSGSVANQNMQAAAILGRIVNVGRLGGNSAAFDFDLHALKRLTYIGVTFRTRSIAEVAELNRLMQADLWGALEAGRLRMPIDSCFPLEQGIAALEHMRANRHFGKIVLSAG